MPHVHVHVITRTLGDGGLTIMSMWPKNRSNGGNADHESLNILASKLRGGFNETP